MARHNFPIVNFDFCYFKLKDIIDTMMRIHGQYRVCCVVIDYRTREIFCKINTDKFFGDHVDRRLSYDDVCNLGKFTFDRIQNRAESLGAIEMFTENPNLVHTELVRQFVVEFEHQRDGVRDHLVERRSYVCPVTKDCEVCHQALTNIFFRQAPYECGVLLSRSQFYYSRLINDMKAGNPLSVESKKLKTKVNDIITQKIKSHLELCNKDYLVIKALLQGATNSYLKSRLGVHENQARDYRARRDNLPRDLFSKDIPLEAIKSHLEDIEFFQRSLQG